MTKADGDAALRREIKAQGLMSDEDIENAFGTLLQRCDRVRGRWTSQLLVNTKGWEQTKARSATWDACWLRYRVTTRRCWQQASEAMTGCIAFLEAWSGRGLYVQSRQSACSNTQYCYSSDL